MRTEHAAIPLYAKRYKSANGSDYEYQTIQEHTWELLDNIERLYREYSEEIEEGLRDLGIDPSKFKRLLYYAAVYHDLGKANALFQKKIRDKGKKDEVPNSERFVCEVPHNYISAAFINIAGLKEDVEAGKLSIDDVCALICAVAFSHDREFIWDEQYYLDYIEHEVLPFWDNPDLSWYRDCAGISALPSDIMQNARLIYRIMRRLFTQKELYEMINFSDYVTRLQVMLKGFLHRLDHASSAQVVIEEERVGSFPEKVEFYLRGKGNFNGFKDFQREAAKLSTRNVILFAPTGSGKTEFGLNWAKGGKLIYTLPIRVSINAMYERFAEIFGRDKVGVLHSDNLLYLMSSRGRYQTEEELEALFNSINLSKNMSVPIIVTTGDQVFTSAMKWPGFEKIYSLFLYSRLVVDEPQSYSPEALAIIIKTLKEMTQINGKFCLMSATINPIIRRHLEGDAEYLQAYSDENLKLMRKHVISVRRNSILEAVDEILQEARRKRVLVICNTVKRAQVIFEAVEEKIGKFGEKIEVELLHSQFIQKQRREKERAVLDYENKKVNGIFIATQIVEASLNIDFDVLFTELSSADSLLQRMGRIYRKREYERKEPNIVIFTEDISGKGTIYENGIVDRTLEFLRNFDGVFISEYDKKELNEYAYDIKAISGTDFMKKFEKAYELLEYGYKAGSRHEAQKVFRNVFTVCAIPYSIYSEHYDEISENAKLLSNKRLSPIERARAIASIRDYTVDIPGYLALRPEAGAYNENLGIFIVDYAYNPKLGLIGNEIEPAIL